MATERKLDISAISFDDMLGDGLESTNSEDLSIDNDVNEEEYFDENISDEEVEDSYVEDNDNEYEDEDEDTEEEDGYTKEESNIIFEIASTLGFEVDEDYEESIEGLTGFVRDMSQKVAEEQLQGLFEQYPEVQKHLDFLMAGGNSSQFLQAYNPQIDYGSIEIDEDNIEMQRALVGQYLQAKGHDNDFIIDMLSTLEDSGRLLSRAEKAKEELAESQEQYRQEMFARQQQEYEYKMRETEEFWNGVADLIEEGNEFAGIKIPDREKSKFFDYISRPIGPNGETQRDLDYADSELEMKLAMDYLVYNGFNIEGIIDKKAKTKSAQSLRDRIISNEDRIKSARKATRTPRFDVDNLDMKALLG